MRDKVAVLYIYITNSFTQYNVKIAVRTHHRTCTYIYKKYESRSSKATVLTQLLHVLAHLDVDCEVFGNTSIDTQRFVLRDIAFRVASVDALLVAVIDKSVEHVGNHIELVLCSCDLLLRRDLWSTTETEEGHLCL